MSLSTCIVGLVKEGRIGKAQAQEAERLYSEAYNDLKGQMSWSAAASLASERTVAALEARAIRKRFLAGLQVKTQQRIADEIGRYGGRSGDAPIDARAGPALLGGDERAKYSNVEARWKSIRGRAHSMMDGILADHSSNIFGQVRNKAKLDNIVREMFGENTGDLSAREMADAWGRTSEMLRQRFNAAGGDIGKMENWGLPQSHDTMKVRRAGFDQWRDAIWDRLDRTKMIDRETGAPFTDKALRAALKDVFETIRSDGWNDRKAGATGKGSMANRHGEERFLAFKSAEDWMAYAEDFGAGSPFDAMMRHIDMLSRDTAMMEILGPNPAHMIHWVKDTITKSAQTDKAPGSEAGDRAHAQGKLMDRLWAELTGDSQRPESRKLSMWFSAYRSLKTAATLGSAALSAVTDLGFQMTTRAMNGLPVRGMLGEYWKLMKPGSIEDRKLAVRMGLIAEDWSSRTAAQSRYLGEEQTGEISRRLAEGTLRASGLNRFTQAGRWAFGKQFIGAITDASSKTWGQLDPAFRGVFERYGIDAKDWDNIRATEPQIDGGVEWIMPADIADQKLADRVMEMILTETDYAVPAVDLRTRAMMNRLAPRGTIGGELLRSAFLVKSVGISVLHMHGRRALAQGAWSGAKYVAGLIAATTLMGAAAMGLKDLVAGRDPRDMTSLAFWAQALVQGGGFGIFGDFVKSTTNRIGGGLGETAAGPLASDIQGIADIALTKDHTSAALRQLKAILPGSSLWYLRLALDRMVADQIHEMVNPGGFAASARRQRKFAREQGTQFFWAPGQALPERAPDLSNIAAGETRQ